MWSIHEPPFLQGIARHGLGSKEEKTRMSDVGDKFKRGQKIDKTMVDSHNFISNF